MSFEFVIIGWIIGWVIWIYAPLFSENLWWHIRTYDLRNASRESFLVYARFGLIWPLALLVLSIHWMLKPKSTLSFRRAQ